MKRIIIFSIIGLVILGVLYFVAAGMIRTSAEGKASLTLAEVVTNYDDQYADMAADALIDSLPNNVFPVLASGLDRTDRGIKLRIIRVLDAYPGEESFEMLTKAVADNDIYVSSRACRALAKRGYNEVLELSKERLNEDDPVLLGWNLETAATFEDDTITLIEKELNCDHLNHQPNALRALVPLIEKGNERAWGLLRRDVTSSYPEVRLAALESSIGLGGTMRDEALKMALESPFAEIKRMSLSELTKGGISDDLKDYLKLALNDPDINIVFTASWGLLKLRDPEPVGKLRSILRDESLNVRDKIIAARLLARFGAPEGADPMYDIIDSLTVADDIKLEAAEVLGEYSEQKGMTLLWESIKNDRPPEVRMKALEMLGLMGNSLATVLLVQMSNDGDERIAVRAAYALTSLGDRRGIGKLRRFLHSNSAEVRTIAAVGIVTGGNITDIIGEEGYR